MKASIVDLRYRMKDVLRALDRGEAVTVLYRGREKASLNPIAQKAMGTQSTPKVADQPFFGMWRDREDMQDAAALVRQVRENRVSPACSKGRHAAVRKRPR